jgi:hypothetical protein
MDQDAVRNQTGFGRLALAAPSFAVSLVMTELFFKWGSFMLELCGFAAVWGALYGVQSLVTGLFKRAR